MYRTSIYEDNHNHSTCILCRRLLNGHVFSNRKFAPLAKNVYGCWLKVVDFLVYIAYSCASRISPLLQVMLLYIL